MLAVDAWLRRMSASIQAWQRALGEAASGGAVLEVGELVASVVPAAPSRSIVNAAAGPFRGHLRGSDLDELARRYDEAGITAWGFWAHQDDEAATDVLEAAGLSVDSRPTAMAMELSTLGGEPGGGPVSVERTDDLALLGEPLGAAYGFPAAFLTRGLPGLLDHVTAWLARVDGMPAAGVLIVRAGDDAGVFMVGTAPALRRQGAAGAALHAALLAARDDGCTTSTLQASEMGRSVYAGLGYHDLGTYLLWERRVGDGDDDAAA